ncbi:MAG TPA: ice-binding family protein, partial [Nitrosopumilaceae archaeon]|nr:ice-binding family protein [Nitrosopumilaceae archaeon]
LGTQSVLKGTVIAFTSITDTTSATVDGRLLALGGAVTMDTNQVTIVGNGNGNGNGNGDNDKGNNGKGDNDKSEHDEGHGDKDKHGTGEHDEGHHDKDAKSDKN